MPTERSPRPCLLPQSCTGILWVHRWGQKETTMQFQKEGQEETTMMFQKEIQSPPPPPTTTTTTTMK